MNASSEKDLIFIGLVIKSCLSTLIKSTKNYCLETQSHPHCFKFWSMTMYSERRHLFKEIYEEVESLIQQHALIHTLALLNVSKFYYHIK